MGSVAFANYVRSCFMIARDKEDETASRLMHVKFNCSVKGDDLMLRPRCVGADFGKSERDQYVTLDWWRPGEGNVDPDRLFGATQESDSGRMTATAWLAKYLKQNGETLKEDVIDAAAEADFKAKAVEQGIARNPGKFMSRREGFPARAFWSLR